MKLFSCAVSTARQEKFDLVTGLYSGFQAAETKEAAVGTFLEEVRAALKEGTVIIDFDANEIPEETLRGVLETAP